MALTKIANVSWKSRGNIVFECELDGRVVACILKDSDGNWRVIPGNLDTMGFWDSSDAKKYVEENLRSVEC